MCWMIDSGKLGLQCRGMAVIKPDQVRHKHTDHVAAVDFFEEGMDSQEELDAEEELGGEDKSGASGKSHIDRVVWCIDLCDSASELTFSLNALKHSGINLMPYDLPAIFKRIKHPSKAMGFYKWVKDEPDLTLASEAYESIVKILCDRKHYGSMWSVLDEMKRNRAGVPDFVFFTIFKSCARAQNSTEAAHAFNRMADYGCKPSEDLYNSLIATLLQCSAEKAAVAYIGRMEQARFRLNDDNINLLRVVQRRSEVHRDYEAILAGDVPHTVEFCCETILKLCKVYKLDEAMEVFRFMARSRFHLTPEVYETLTNYLAETERSADALKVFKVLVKLKDRPTFFTCIWVASSLVMDLKFRDARMIVEALKGSKYRFKLREYITRLCVATLTKATWDLLRFMKYSGYQPNRGTYIACVRAAHKRLKKPLVVQDVIRAGGSSMLLPSNLLLKILANSDHRYLWDFVRFMEEKKLKPNSYSYSRLIKAYYKADKMKFAWQAYEEMRSKDMFPSSWAYACLVHDAAWSISGDYAVELFDEAVEKRGLPHPRMAKHLIVTLCYRGCSDTALRIYKELKARGAVLHSSLRVLRCLRTVKTAATRELLAEIEEDILHRWQVASGIMDSVS
ncbi:pentatricopeptide repeat-containing protein At1g71060, mitochondrial isoform X1 [Selaginella moellendorffii]|uniref:pentatricopeptide repeat-containing protein At1g71060, mitochondrial isoform X1 n=1 Tax=Selaginella moellendorffii TaxID=88036 RepID=UPI000D1CD400|nr:pentatricopeptide repeat-containing protein At1g71060, mitochondrial isoform X1 [Selaginella moellendorffii]|eukprot:XP_024518279.1 pentatricopeptide repeat-containing protein At1g71060, mitochondrial isoform X1 [Selaginella moellendorffii]